MKDNEALDRLAHRFQIAGEDGEVNGGDLVELVGELLRDTGRATSFTLATPENMRKFAEQSEGARCKAISLSVPGEEASADAGDYFMMPDGEPLIDSEDEPMILVIERTELHDALTGAVI